MDKHIEQILNELAKLNERISRMEQEPTAGNRPTFNRPQRPEHIPGAWKQSSTRVFYGNRLSKPGQNQRGPRPHQDYQGYRPHRSHHGYGPTRVENARGPSTLSPEVEQLSKLLFHSCQLRHHSRNWTKLPVRLERQLDTIFKNIVPPMPSSKLKEGLQKINRDCKSQIVTLISRHIEGCQQEVKRSMAQVQNPQFDNAAVAARSNLLDRFRGSMEVHEINGWLEEDRRIVERGTFRGQEENNIPVIVDGTMDTPWSRPSRGTKRVISPENSPSEVVTSNRFSPLELEDQAAEETGNDTDHLAQSTSNGKPAKKTKTQGPAASTGEQGPSASTGDQEATAENARTEAGPVLSPETAVKAPIGAQTGPVEHETTTEEGEDLNPTSISVTGDQEESGLPKKANDPEGEREEPDQGQPEDIVEMAEDDRKTNTPEVSRRRSTGGATGTSSQPAAQVAGGQVVRHPTSPKNTWTVKPRSDTDTIIIGDANMQLANNLPQTWEAHAFPGADLNNTALIIGRLEPSKNLKNVIIAVGLSNRTWQPINIKHEMNKVASAVTKKKLKGYFQGVTIPATLTEPETTSLKELNCLAAKKFVRAYIHPPMQVSASPIKTINSIKTDIIYNQDTVNKIIDQIRKHFLLTAPISLTPPRNFSL